MSLPWAACFLLGAIGYPTDTVAVHAVLERLRVPRRATAILGGESLVNDATGLRAVYRAQTDALLARRDQGVVNDRVHQELQLDLDRANSELRAG